MALRKGSAVACKFPVNTRLNRGGGITDGEMVLAAQIRCKSSQRVPVKGGRDQMQGGNPSPAGG
jgi:hypothetical protein